MLHLNNWTPQTCTVVRRHKVCGSRRQRLVKPDNMGKKTSRDKQCTTKRVLIVGGGAAGTACAYSLARFPHSYDIHMWEKRPVPGGVAVSSDIKGGIFINDGVQGGCPSYRNTVNIMKQFGFQGTPVHMMISFGKGSSAWTNYSETELIKKLKPDIKRFESVLKRINRFEAFYLFVPIAKVLRWFNFSDDFCNEMVFPLTALFFGTGNQTPNVSAAIVARVFLDDDLRLFDYDPERLLSQKPEMFAFPKLEHMYKTIIEGLGINFHGHRAVRRVRREGGKVHVQDAEGVWGAFDELVFACDAETALASLERPSYWERKALSNVRYYNDLIVTHEDEDYMNKYYELHNDVDQYFVRTDPNDKEKIEMSFNLSNYQPQLKNKQGRNIYQTIYLDDQLKDIWTRNDLNEEKVLLQTWWRQFAHTWKHFAFTTPLIRYIQGTKHTWYCGAYTLVNTHEVATISGLAAAHRLGAPYPFPDDPLAAKQFDQYLMVIHGTSRQGGFSISHLKSILLAPFAFIFAILSLFLGVFLNRS